MDVLHGHLQGACKKQGNCGEATVLCIMNENPGNVPTSCRRVTRLVESPTDAYEGRTYTSCRGIAHTIAAGHNMNYDCSERSWPLDRESSEHGEAPEFPVNASKHCSVCTENARQGSLGVGHTITHDNSEPMSVQRMHAS